MKYDPAKYDLLINGKKVAGFAKAEKIAVERKKEKSNVSF